MSKHLAAVPNIIHLSAFDIDVRVLPEVHHEGQRCYGLWKGDTQEVLISEEAPSDRMATCTLMHEIFHAIWWAYDIAPKEQEESTVTRLSHGLGEVFVRNPGLLTWIQKGLK